VFRADDAQDRERIGEADRQRRQRVSAYPEAHARAALDEFALGVHGRLDVVVEDVVVRKLVFVVEAAARAQLLRRRVDRDVAMLRTVEERDIFGLTGRPRVSERAVLLGSHFREEVAEAGKEVPGIATQIAQIEAE
jgi:hypothetical protein